MSDQPAPANKPSSANKQQKQKQSNTRKGKKPMQQQQTAKQQQPQKQKNKATPRQVMMTWEDELPGALHRRFSKLQWDIKQKARTQVQQTQRQGRETLLNQKRGNKTSSMPQEQGPKTSKGKAAVKGGGRPSLPGKKLGVRTKATAAKRAHKGRAKKMAAETSK